MLLNNSVANAQSQACALAHRLGRVERVKGAVQIGESGPRVFHFQVGAVSSLQCAYSDLAWLGFALHRIDGVVEQVQQNLLELVFIDRHTRQIGLYIDHNC